MERLKRIKKETEFNYFNMPETGEFALAFNLKKDDFDWLIEQIEYLQNRKDEVLLESGKRWTKLIKIKQILEEE